MNSRFLLFAASIFLGACSMQPHLDRPQAPVAASWPAVAPAPEDASSATEVGWQSFFRDERLRSLIALALANNRDLRISALRIDEARGQYRIQRADRLPTVAAGASATRSRTSPASLGDAPAGVVSTDPSNRFEVDVGVSAFELDFWGRVRSLSDAARANYLATLEGERAFRISLIADVASAYLTLRALDERIALAAHTVTTREKGLELAKSRLDAGVTSALDYRQTETLLTQAQTELATLYRQQAQTRNALSVLIGGPFPSDMPPARPLSAQGLDDRIGAGLPSDLLVNRPDVLGAEQSLRAANANIGAARAAFFPRISLTGAFGFASTDLDNLVGEGGKTWSFGPSISLPIFDFGRNKANLDVAEARKNIAVATYEKTVQTAFQEVADALAARRFLSEQVDAQTRALAAQRDLAELAELRYRNGVASYLEVLDAQRNLFSAEQTLVQTRRDQLANLVSLYVAVGGGLKP